MKGLIWKNVWQAGVAICVLFAIWLLAFWRVGNELLVPDPLTCLKEGWRLFGKAAFWRGFFASFSRTLIAFFLSFLFALIFAVVAYLLPSFAGIFAPLVSMFRSLPVMAVLLILLSIFKAATVPVAVAFLSLFPMLYTGVYNGLSGVDKHLVQTARVYGATPWRQITRVYLPLTAPALLREIGGGLSFSLKLVVSAEILANTAVSLGGMMQEARVYAEVARLFALVGVAFSFGLILELLFAALATKAENSF